MMTSLQLLVTCLVLIVSVRSASNVSSGWYETSNRTGQGRDGSTILYRFFSPLPDTLFNVSHPEAENVMRDGEMQRQQIEADARAGVTFESQEEAFRQRVTKAQDAKAYAIATLKA